MSRTQEHPIARGLSALPGNVLALVLRDASVLDMVHVAHVCLALHRRIAGADRCQCAHVIPPRHAIAFWAHWCDVRAPSVLQLGDAMERGSVACVHYALCVADHSHVWTNGELFIWAARHGHWAAFEHMWATFPYTDLNDVRIALALAIKDGGKAAIVERLARFVKTHSAPPRRQVLGVSGAGGKRGSVHRARHRWPR